MDGSPRIDPYTKNDKSIMNDSINGQFHWTEIYLYIKNESNNELILADEDFPLSWSRL